MLMVMCGYNHVPLFPCQLKILGSVLIETESH